jgi:uncharacterized protein YecE (DUF72 family)
MALHVGTSGWAYREWKPLFYPQELPQARFLEHYAGQLTACEINATFYRVQSAQTLTGWAAATPETFRFAVKAHRALTHGAGFPPAPGDDGLLARFLASLGSLGPRLGVMLVQLPPHRQRDDAALERLLASFAGAPPLALEFRHESWAAPGVAERVAAAGATVCHADWDGPPPPGLPPGPVAYVRLRADSYPDEYREAWRELLGREAAERDVYAFCKHEGVPAGDPHAGVGLAQWLVAASAA